MGGDTERPPVRRNGQLLVSLRTMMSERDDEGQEDHSAERGDWDGFRKFAYLRCEDGDASSYHLTLPDGGGSL